MTISYYPIALQLSAKRVIVAGGGRVAERKVKTLLEFKAKICVISPELTLKLKSLVKSGKIRWVKRCVRKSDFCRAGIVIAATSEKKINNKISQWAKSQKALVNVVDKPDLSNFISPAVFHKKEAIVAVYTDGKNPVLSRDLKNFLEDNWDVFLSYRDKL